MEINILSQHTLRVKGKQASFVVDPDQSMPKTPADFIITLVKNQKVVFQKIDGFRVVINAPGEFEIGGIKVNTHGFEDVLIYDVIVDGIDILIANSEGLKKAKEKIKETHVVIVKTDTVVDESSVTAVTPCLVVLYGINSVESAKVLGEQNTKSVNKISYTLEKLPREMEVVILD